jgi:hypothetical protein
MQYSFHVGCTSINVSTYLPSTLAVLYLLNGTVWTNENGTTVCVPTSMQARAKFALKAASSGRWAPPLTDRHDDGLDEPKTRKQKDQRQRRLAKYYKIKTTVLFYGLVARDDENPMVACQNWLRVWTIPRLCDETMWCDAERRLVGGQARARIQQIDQSTRTGRGERDLKSNIEN